MEQDTNVGRDATAECRFEGCLKPAKHLGLCQGHYTQWRRNQPLRPLRSRRPATAAAKIDGVEVEFHLNAVISSPSGDRICSLPFCNRPHAHLGLCGTHYRHLRQRRILDVLADWTEDRAVILLDGVQTPFPLGQSIFNEAGQRVCSLPFCGHLHSGLGLCEPHRSAAREGRVLTPLAGPRRRVRTGSIQASAWPAIIDGHEVQFELDQYVVDDYGLQICSLPFCAKPAFARGLCNGHWQQPRGNRPLTPMAGQVPEAVPAMVGGQMIDFLLYQDVRDESGSRICSLPGCTNQYKALGLCEGHAQQRRLGQILTLSKKVLFEPGDPCRNGCGNDLRLRSSHGLCAACYQRQQRLRRGSTTCPFFFGDTRCDNPAYQTYRGTSVCETHRGRLARNPDAVNAPRLHRQALVQGVNDLASVRPDLAAEADGWDPTCIHASAARVLSWRCRPCSETWDATPARRSSGRGCPACAVTGYDQTKPGHLYWLTDASQSMVKVGITNFLAQRLGQHARQGLTELVYTRKYEDGRRAPAIEMAWKRAARKQGYVAVPREVIRDGFTEVFWLEDRTLSDLFSQVPIPR